MGWVYVFLLVKVDHVFGQVEVAQLFGSVFDYFVQHFKNLVIEVVAR